MKIPSDQYIRFGNFYSNCNKYITVWSINFSYQWFHISNNNFQFEILKFWIPHFNLGVSCLIIFGKDVKSPTFKMNSTKRCQSSVTSDRVSQRPDTTRTVLLLAYPKFCRVKSNTAIKLNVFKKNIQLACQDVIRIEQRKL